jgi:hypothetical protein
MRVRTGLFIEESTPNRGSLADRPAGVLAEPRSPGTGSYEAITPGGPSLLTLENGALTLSDGAIV